MRLTAVVVHADTKGASAAGRSDAVTHPVAAEQSRPLRHVQRGRAPAASRDARAAHGLCPDQLPPQAGAVQV